MFGPLLLLTNLAGFLLCFITIHQRHTCLQYQYLHNLFFSNPCWAPCFHVLFESVCDGFSL